MIRPLLLFLALALPASAQTIEAPSGPVPAHKLARLRVSGAESVAWIVLPVGAADQEVSADTSRLVFAAPPGSYTVLAATVKAGKVAFLSASVTIGGQPVPPPVPPGPTPDPTPTPPPTPVSGTLHATLIYDAETATPAIGDLRSDGKLVEDLAGLDARWYAVEKDSAEFKRWWPSAKAVSPPCVVVIDGKGKVWAEARPGTAAEVVETVRKLRGR
jgi:hypothetical protein